MQCSECGDEDCDCDDDMVVAEVADHDFDPRYMTRVTEEKNKGELKNFSTKIDILLEQLFAKFNAHRSPNSHGLSLSVTDVVGIKMHGYVSFHFVGFFGFKLLPDGFL